MATQGFDDMLAKCIVEHINSQNISTKFGTVHLVLDQDWVADIIIYDDNNLYETSLFITFLDNGIMIDTDQLWGDGADLLYYKPDFLDRLVEILRKITKDSYGWKICL